MIELLKKLSESDHTFLDRFSNSFPDGQRKLVSRNRSDLYPGRPDFLEDRTMSKEFKNGWWIGLNYSKRSIKKHIEEAIKIAGKRRGDFVDFDLLLDS